MLLAGVLTPSPGKSFQEEQAGRSKNTTLLHWPFALLVVENTRDHNQTSHLKTYLHSPWEAGEFLRTDEEMLKIEKRGIICSTWEPPLKDPGAFQAHFSVVRWHHFWVQAYACHFTFIIEWPVRFQPASPIPILCFYPLNCIKHRVPTCSMRTLDPHRDKSCLILSICKLLWIKPHLGEKKQYSFLLLYLVV